MRNGYILKQLTEENKDYLPTVEIFYPGHEHPEIEIMLTLPTLPTKGQFDELRLSLTKWTEHCGFGELAEENE